MTMVSSPKGQSFGCLVSDGLTVRLPAAVFQRRLVKDTTGQMTKMFGGERKSTSLGLTRQCRQTLRQ